jgi:hypothetical protein
MKFVGGISLLNFAFIKNSTQNSPKIYKKYSFYLNNSNFIQSLPVKFSLRSQKYGYLFLNLNNLMDSDDEEVFKDIQEEKAEVQAPEKSESEPESDKSEKPKKNRGEYDSNTLDPKMANAEGEGLWELSRFLGYYNPTVRKWAELCSNPLTLPTFS